MIEQAGVLAYRILAVAKIDPSEIGYNEYIENDDAAIVSILNQVYIVAGMVAVITIVIAGLAYVASRGNAERTKQARNAIMGALVGIVIIISAFAVTQFVIWGVTQ